MSLSTYISAANLPFWYALPMGVTHFGGDTQVFTIPDLGTNNVGLMLNGQAQLALQQASAAPQFGLQAPGVTQDSVTSYAQNLLTPIYNRLTSSKINVSLQNVAMTKTKLNSMLQKEGITNDEKNKINELLDRLNKEEEKLKELTTSQNLDPQTAYEKAAAIESNIRNIVNDMNALSNPNASTTTSTTSTTSTTNTTNTSDTSDTTTSTTASKPFSAKTVDLVDDFYDATYCTGTDDETFNRVCESINEDNVMDVMLAWAQLHGTEDGESFMVAFMDDADHDQKVKYGKHIARQLRNKAMELGIYDKCKDDFAAIDKEMGSWLYIDNDVAKNYDNIIRIIAEKEGRTYSM